MSNNLLEYLHQNKMIINDNDMCHELETITQNFPVISYDSWITAWRKEKPKAGGMCYLAAKMMAEVFPELRITKGRVIASSFSFLKVPHSPVDSYHWWCVDTDGNIQDPTADQFTDIILYIPE